MLLRPLVAVTVITAAMEEVRGCSTKSDSSTYTEVGCSWSGYVMSTQVPNVSLDCLHIKLGICYWYCDSMVRVTTGTKYQHNEILINNERCDKVRKLHHFKCNF